MPKCSKFKRLCSLDNIPDVHGNCKNEIISIFDQGILKGWWPLYKMVEGERVMAVLEPESKTSSCHLCFLRRGASGEKHHFCPPSIYSTEDQGKLEMSVEVVTEEDHEERPAGQGRDEPNMHPKLDKPNRPATSFAWFSSPFKSFRYIIWRKYKWIILGILFLLLVVAFIVLFIYSFPGVISTSIVE